MWSRRRFLEIISAGPLVGGFTAASPGPAAAAPARRAGRDYFRELGVRPFINAAGTYTAMTASLMPPEVLDAINYASKHYVMLDELHDKVGARIATLLHCEAAMVTSGAASALTLGTAAVLTGTDRQKFVELGKKHGIPTLNDAAADVPPVDNLWKYTRMGFDLVAFSSGKGLRGPQSAGVLLGRKDLIAAARLNAPPNGNTIGRGLKVNKEEMLGMLVALEKYLANDHRAERREFDARAEAIRSGVATIPGIKAEIFVPEVANHVPHVRISWDAAPKRMTPTDAVNALRAGEPSIGTRSEGDAVVIGVWMMRPGEEKIVARRLREVLEKRS